LVLGLLIASAARAPLAIACALVGFFAVFHGFAHGAEIPMSASVLSYVAGFIGATAILHMIGIGAGMLLEQDAPRKVLRATGVAVACVGALLIVGVL
jgi:urease accessory protein